MRGSKRRGKGENLVKLSKINSFAEFFRHDSLLTKESESGKGRRKVRAG